MGWIFSRKKITDEILPTSSTKTLLPRCGRINAAKHFQSMAMECIHLSGSQCPAVVEGVGPYLCWQAFKSRSLRNGGIYIGLCKWQGFSNVVHSQLNRRSRHKSPFGWPRQCASAKALIAVGSSIFLADEQLLKMSSGMNHLESDT